MDSRAVGGELSPIEDRPDRPLVVKLAFSNLPRRINFRSAATCRFEALKQRVEECYHLSASSFYLSYLDEDGEETAIKNEDDWTDTISWFLSGDDELATDTVRMGLQPPSSKIVVRLDVVIEYDGPSLSETSSIAGNSEEYSSTDDGTSESMTSETSWKPGSHGSLLSHNSALSTFSSRNQRSLRNGHSAICYPVAGEQSSREDSNPQGQNLVESSHHAMEREALAARELSSRWLEEQTRLALRKMGAPSSAGRYASSRGTSEDGSFIDSEDDHSVGNLSLSQDASGRYYYSYNDTSAALPGGQQANRQSATPSKCQLLCSGCSCEFDYMCYVCTACAYRCGDSTQGSVNSDDSSSSERTAWAAQMGRRSPESDGSDTIYNEPRSRSDSSLARQTSNYTSNSAIRNGSGWQPRTLPSATSFELCPNCIETIGLEHAMSHLESIDHRRHAFSEQIKTDQGWVVVGQEIDTACYICEGSLGSEHFKCVSCSKFTLCSRCYPNANDVHPAHVFLRISSPNSESQSMMAEEVWRLSLPSASGSMPPNMRVRHSTLEHEGAFCHNCLNGIYGVRYHCAVCPSWDLCEECEGSSEAVTGQHTSDHIMMKIPQPLPAAEVAAITRRARDRWFQQDAPAVAQVADRAQSGRPLPHDDVQPEALAHRKRCNQCNQWIQGVRFQCANCPSSPASYNLCVACEPRSHRVHDPLHAFFRLDRPVDWPLESPVPLLPLLYKSKVGRVPVSAANHPRTTTSYLSYLVHQDTLCDVHGDQIRGVWMRCAHCADGFDMCGEAQPYSAHDETHVFLILKAPVDMVVFRAIVALESDHRRPLLTQRVYRS